MMNPILNKELTIGSRSMKMSLHLMLYNLIMAVIAIITMTVAKQSGSYSGSDGYRMMMALFPMLATLQCFIILFMIPVLTASSIAGERERQTLDVLLTTPISPFSIVIGKVFASMGQVLMYVLSSLPVMSLAFIIGGMSWIYIFGFIAMVIYASFYVGAVGVYCSAKRKKTISSVISSFIIIAAAMVATALIFYIKIYGCQLDYYDGKTLSLNYGLAPLWMVINPAVPVGNYICQAYFGFGIADLGISLKDNLTSEMFFLTQHWNVISILVNLVVAFFFIWRASKQINPLKKVTNKHKHKEAVKVEDVG